ncbi:MAG: transketolase C-terminal domain-containing protein [Eggerthellaceae bacterium]|nr:transketolase C-terminal domain-containing protein [Eggerthellaceae bacterium]
MKRFLSGDEALAEGVRLARPQVISAYPITPQTVVVERLSEMVEAGQLKAEYIHVESEHSALSAAMGASATGARTFTATSSQGLLYMAEVLTYAAGGRFPIVMMNANRATALPWNIYGDQRDSLALLDHGWIQAYVQDNQEALDMALMAYAIAEDPRVSTPFMVNLDGFALTHTYENVEIPTPEEADAFLPPFRTDNKFNFENPVNMGYSAGPEYNRYFKYWAHRDMMGASEVIAEVEARFAEAFGRRYPGLVEAYRAEDADVVLVTLGSIAGLVRSVVDELRAEGVRAGLVRIRYMRPFPARELTRALANAQAVGVLEKDVSFGAEGTVFTNVNSALQQAGDVVPTVNFVGGLGGDDITPDQVRGAFATLRRAAAGESGPSAPKIVSRETIPTESSERAAGLSTADKNVSRETSTQRRVVFLGVDDAEGGR